MITARIYLITVALSFLAGATQAQTLKERIAAMQNEYVTLRDVHIRMTVQVFESDDSKTPFYQNKGEIKRRDLYYEYQLGNMSMLMNHDYLIVVNGDSREIVCSRRSLDEESKMYADPFKANMDSILNLYTTPVLVDKQGAVEHYRLDQKIGPVNRIELFIDDQKNVLRKMIYNYRTGQHAVIEFSVFDKAPQFDADTFREGKYIQWTNGKVIPAEAYKAFHVAMVENNDNRKKK